MPVTRKATAVERPRCNHCRNPIKEHHAALTDGDGSFHEDCWKSTHPDHTPPVADVPEGAAEQVVEQSAPEPSSEQRDYEQRIASGGLAALLSPYVSGLPAQRNSTQSIPA